MPPQCIAVVTWSLDEESQSAGLLLNAPTARVPPAARGSPLGTTAGRRQLARQHGVTSHRGGHRAPGTLRPAARYSRYGAAPLLSGWRALNRLFCAKYAVMNVKPAGEIQSVRHHISRRQKGASADTHRLWRRPSLRYRHNLDRRKVIGRLIFQRDQKCCS